MRLPKGFGKNYFTLRAITATVNQVTLNALRTRIIDFHTFTLTSGEKEELEEEDPPIECLIRLSQKPCYCNRYFQKKALKTLALYTNQNYFFDYFKTLNNSASPPKRSLIQPFL